MLKISMTNKVKEHIGFHYLFTEMFYWNDSTGIEYVLQDVLNKIKDKSISHNIFRIQSNNMWILMYCFLRIYDCSKNLIRLYQFIFA